MIHKFQNKRERDNKNKFIKNIIVIFIFFIIFGISVYLNIGSFLYKIGLPLWKFKNISIEKTEDLNYIIKTKKSVYRENQKLINENLELKNQMIDYSLLKEDNEKLKEFFNRIPFNKKLTLANILTKPSFSPYDTIIIDLGYSQNVNIGDKVYANNIIPVGTISKINKNSSLVTLYSNPGQVNSVMMNGSNSILELIGRGGGNFEMLIPIDLPLLNNAIVFIPNLESEVVAIVKEVISGDNDPVKKLLLSAPVNIQNLKWVFVEKSK